MILVEAIEATLWGEHFVSLAVAQHGSITAQGSTDHNKRALSSEREVEVLRWLAQGQRTREIAGTLGISAKTVETYRSRIMLKLGIDNLPGLVKFAIRVGIASTEL